MEISRAKGLERLMVQNQREDKFPKKAGKPWSKEEEDETLVKGFEAGRTTKDLSVEHARTEGAIRSRLVRLERIEVR